MWTHTKSPALVVDELRKRKPPYCPNVKCSFHYRRDGSFTRHGKRTIQRYPYVTFRYKCSFCQKVFSSSFFSLSYRDRLSDSYEEVHDLHLWGVSKRESARYLKCSEFTVRKRLEKLARWSLLRLARDRSRVQLQEPVAYDGLENFAFSQFDPNNLNHVVGKESFFTYDFNFAPLNRKGRMSPGQKRKKRTLEKEFGPYPRDAIETATQRVFTRLLKSCPGTLHLHSDNHYAYRTVVDRLPEGARIAHFITPAKVARNYRNRLFPINHLDMLTRHNLASFKRETIAFAKHSIAMQESFAILVGYKNYLRPRFWKKHVRDKEAHRESPAMRLGLTNRILKFAELYRERITNAQVELSDDWQLLFQRIDPLSRRPIRPYVGI